jgi:hypothetical protein
MIEEKKILGESPEGNKGRYYQPRHGHMNKLKIGASYPAKWPSEWGNAVYRDNGLYHPW